MIKKPHGMILVTGPTGSGKTTTLYGALTELNRPEVKIITAEDPVEYRLPRITQVQVNPKIGLEFANVLRSALRQDPDVILVGEMRDRETVEIGLRAAMTGHLNHDGLIVEYAEVRDPTHWTAQLPQTPLERAQALIAVRIGSVRLIDNLRLDQ